MPATKLSPLYLKLLRAFPLRPIRSDEELDRAVSVSMGLDIRRAELTAEERDYHEVLVKLIEGYEDEKYPIPDVSGPEMLRFLIEDRGVTQAEVARGTGIGESALSEILAGKRPMGLKVIETLARQFGVAAALFLPGGAVGVTGTSPRGKTSPPVELGPAQKKRHRGIARKAEEREGKVARPEPPAKTKPPVKAKRGRSRSGVEDPKV